MNTTPLLMANFDAFFLSMQRSDQAIDDESNWCRFKFIADNINKNIPTSWK